MSADLRFRPHHFLCSVGFAGKGYSEDFTTNMTDIVVGLLRAPGGEGAVIKVTEAADDICAPCPSRRGTGCESAARIDRLDRSHAAALGLSAGDQLTWGQALLRIKARIAPDDLDRICAGCQWLSLGLCKAALERLHKA